MVKSDLILKDGRIYHVGIKADEIAPDILLVGDPERAWRVAERFDSVDHEVRNREYLTLTGRLRERRISVIGTGIGTDNLEIALLEAYALLAFDLPDATPKPDRPAVTAIRIGTSGGVQADVAPGTLCVSSYALGLDSTGIYLDVPVPDGTAAALEEKAALALAEGTPEGRRFEHRLPVYASRADEGLVQAMASRAAERDMAYVVGVTVAVPGFYGASGRVYAGLTNTVPDIKGRLAGVAVGPHRVINTEMESSLLFHVGAGLGIRTATICPVIGAPGAQDAVLDYKPFVEAAIDIAVETILE